MGCPELLVTFWTVRSGDVLFRALGRVLDSQEEDVCCPQLQLHFGHPGVRMCCSELPVTSWTAMSKDELPSAPCHFLDSQEW